MKFGSLPSLAGKHDSDAWQANFNEDLVIIELNDDEIRLLYNVLLEQAQEHYSYSSTSEVAERLYKLATRFRRPAKNYQT